MSNPDAKIFNCNTCGNITEQIIQNRRENINPCLLTYSQSF